MVDAPAFQRPTIEVRSPRPLETISRDQLQNAVLLVAELRPCFVRHAGRRPTLLDTGSLVHESYIRFAEARHITLEDRVHFMRWAVCVMRSVIVDFARRRLAARRGAGAARVTHDVEHAPAPAAAAGASEILNVHQALERIAAIDPRLSQVVEMRYFGGMTEPEIAQALSVTERTVRRDWQKARMLLREALA